MGTDASVPDAVCRGLEPMKVIAVVKGVIVVIYRFAVCDPRARCMITVHRWMFVGEATIIVADRRFQVDSG
jgi:hypothetical protein